MLPSGDVPATNVRKRISSFEKKPDSGAMPAMASVETRNVQRVSGMPFLRPPMVRMSCASNGPS